MAATSSPVTGAYTPRITTPATTNATKDVENTFSSEAFMKVLATQMKSQNPLEPMKDTEFIAQMAQFSNLEQITNLATTMKSLNITTQLTQGASLIGRTVTYTPAGTDQVVTGTVDKMLLENGGRSSVLVVGGVRVDPALVREVH